ncbi:MAG: response regulator [Lachnospiraceae bacterium]|nr:response regulator [Lachnospiraceae bacterium]
MYKIIIIDDEEKIAEGIAHLFPWEQMGFSVAAYFRSGKKALEYIREHPVDVLVSDIEMPDLSGLALCEHLTGSAIRIVFISSYQNYEYFRSAIRYKVEDYLLKPIKFQELSECFRKIKEELDEENHVPEETPVAYYDQIVREVKHYIEQNYRDASQNEAAVLVGMSSGYLSKIFKEKSGKGFMEYLTEIRMQKACELLDNIQFKSYDVAYYVGYDNPKNFSRAFKAYYGMTPKEYRSHKGING